MYRNPKRTPRVLRNVQIYHNCIKRHVMPDKDVVGKPVIVLDLGAGKLNDLLNYPAHYIVHAVEIDPESVRLGKIKYNKYRKSHNLCKIHYHNANVLSKKIYDVLGDDLVVDHVICNFAFHYFMGSKTHCQHVIDIIKKYLKPGGTFSLTAMNGDILESRMGYKEYTISDNQFDILRVRKMWKQPSDFGQTVNIYIISIGKWHKEFLVKPNVLIATFKENGFGFDKQYGFRNFDYFEYIKINDIYGKPIRGFKLKKNALREFSHIHMYLSFRKLR